jgi:hypothetical protein
VNLRPYNEVKLVDPKSVHSPCLQLLEEEGMVVGRGGTLLHFSTQPDPLLSLQSTESTRRVPQKVLTSSRK